MITTYRKLLERGIRVRTIVLFGSYARETAHAQSDIDIAVVSPDFEGVPMNRRAEILARLDLGCDPRISPIGYSPSEYGSPAHHSFLSEVLRTGRVVYEAAA